MVNILFVCLGNICRSPAAEGILKHFAAQNNFPLELHIESCGLGDWHIGHLPDERMRDTAKARGVILSSRAQKFQLKFFDTFDYILVADQPVLRELYQYATNAEQKAKIHLMTDFSSSYKGQEVPDPYYRGEGDFELVLDMLEDSCEGLLKNLLNKNL